MKSAVTGCLGFIMFIGVTYPLAGADWPRFRGPGGSAISTDAKVPLNWSESKNLKWKVPLPGPGSSSPIISGERVFVTCYSGYGLGRDGPGSPQDLRRHLLCIGRKDGKVLWSKPVDAALPEDAFGGMGITEHGYASSTPVADGQIFLRSNQSLYCIEESLLKRIGNIP